MSKIFNWYDDWRTAVLECPKCHWIGRFSEGAAGQFAELIDCSCPQCDAFQTPVLAIVSFPTLQEMLGSGNPDDVREAGAILERRRAFEAVKLKSKEQLPDITDENFAATWDQEWENDSKSRTVIRHADIVLFSEPALWEGYRGRLRRSVECFERNMANGSPTSSPPTQAKCTCAATR
jgi:hypothetical protein